MTDAIRSRRSALQDLAQARRAWRAEHDSGKPLPDSPPLVPHRVPWIFSRARRALWAGARLEPDEHAELLARIASAQTIPAEVNRYLAQRPGAGRPRRLTTAERERRGLHACWLLWGYYARIGRPEPRESAWATTAILLNVSAGTVEGWKKRAALRPW